jgi:Ca2+-binding EF-hand superfamily protein
VDIAKNGRIDYAEFLIATMDFKKKLTAQMLHDIFTYFDYSNHGFIDVSDLKHAFQKIGLSMEEDQLQVMID